MKSNLSTMMEIGIAYTINTVVYIGAGYLYGTLFNANKLMAARALIIYTLTTNTFRLLNEKATGGEKNNPHVYYPVQVIGDVLGVICIFAFRRLNLIAEMGTITLSAALYIHMLITLIKLNKAYQAQPVKS
jgi:hypothetical protein